MKKIIVPMLALLLLALPVTVRAQFMYTMNADNTITITNYTGSSGIVIFPTNIAGLTVTGIGDGSNAISPGGTITNVTIPNTVTSISDWAFEDCDLTNVTIADSVTSIGGGAFYYCTSLPGFTIPSGLTEIGYETFYYCTNMTNITFPGNITTISTESFEYCGLQNVIIPNTVAFIGESAFYECTNMTNLTVGDNANLSKVGCTIEEDAFEECYALKNAAIGSSVVYIGEDAFEECTNLNNLAIGTNLTSANAPFPNGPCFIGEDAFEECYRLTNAVIGNSVANIGYAAFYESFYYPSNGGSLTIGNNVLLPRGCGIGEDAFEECYGLKNLTIGQSVTSIGDDAFYECTNLTTAMINPTGPIAEDAFYECYRMSNVVIGPTVASIGEYAFYEAFRDSSNGSVTIGTNMALPGGGTAINEGAFEEAYGLTNLTIGNSVTSIAEDAFYDCTNLNTATINNSGPIGEYAFYDCHGLKNLMIGRSVTSIAYYAFYGCTNWMTATIDISGPINEGAFGECYGLTNLTIGTNVTSIGYDAFEEIAFYPSNSSVVIGGGTIQEYAFDDSEGLQSVTFGPNVTSIGYSAFYECYALTNIVIPDNVTTIGSYAFDECYDLTNITIGKGVTDIGEEVFEECYALTNVTFGANVKSIGYETFDDCTNLTSLYFKGNAPSVDSAAFYYDTNASLTAYYFSGATGWGPALDGIRTLKLAPNSLQVTLGPSAAIDAGAEWQLNGGTSQTAALTTQFNLIPGNYTVSFAPVSGWLTPSNQSFTITNVAGSNAIAISVAGFYTPTNTPGNGLILLTNGDGTIKQVSWPKVLVDGTKYTATAVPAADSIFVSWMGGTSQPYAVLSTSTTYKFTMEADLVLIANFAPNPFNPGVYNGLFSVSNGVTEQTAGMLKGLTITTKGAYSGALMIDGASHTIKGTFSSSGLATNLISRSTAQGGPLVLEMTLVNPDNSAPQVIGTVSGTNNGVPWVATNLLADQAANTLPSAEYTMLIMPDTNNAPPASSPGGAGYMLITNYPGTAKNPASANAKITGALADGTAFTQSVPVSEDGYIPVYASLYANKGLLLGWISLDPNNMTGVGLTWIHPVTTKGLYKSGFTNMDLADQLPVSMWTNPPANLDVLTNLSTLPTFDATNGVADTAVTISAAGQVTGTGVTGSINLKTGLLKVVVGTGASKVTGYGAVLLNSTNAGGYFLTSTNAEALELQP